MQQDTDTSIPDIPDIDTSSSSPTGAMLTAPLAQPRTLPAAGKPWLKYAQKEKDAASATHTVSGEAGKDVRSDDQGWLTDAISGTQMFGQALAHGFAEDNPIDPVQPATSKYSPQNPEYQKWEQAYRAKAKDRSVLTTTLPEFAGQTLAAGPAGVGAVGAGIARGTMAADRAAIEAGRGLRGLRGGGATAQRIERAVGSLPGGGPVAAAVQQRGRLLSQEAERFAANLAGESAPEMTESEAFRTPLQRAGRTLERQAATETIASPESRRLVENALANGGGPENVFRVLVTSRTNPVHARQLIYPLMHSLGGVRNTRLLAGAMIDQLGRSSLEAGTIRTAADWNVATFLENISQIDRSVLGRIFGHDALDTAELGSDLATSWRQIVDRLQQLHRYRSLMARGAEEPPEFFGTDLLRGAVSRRSKWGWAGEGGIFLYSIITGHFGTAAAVASAPAATRVIAEALTHPRTAAYLASELARTTAFASGTEGGKGAGAFLGFGDAGAISDIPTASPEMQTGKAPEEVSVTGRKVPTDIRPE